MCFLQFRIFREKQGSQDGRNRQLDIMGRDRRNDNPANSKPESYHEQDVRYNDTKIDRETVPKDQ